jgi:hypothetical protein
MSDGGEDDAKGDGRLGVKLLERESFHTTFLNVIPFLPLVFFFFSFLFLCIYLFVSFSLSFSLLFSLSLSLSFSPSLFPSP